MQIGIFLPFSEDSVRPGPFAAAVEARGFDGLFVPEHTHIPVAEQTYPDGRPLDPGYARNFDPYLTLTAAAATTSRIRLGTSVTLLAQRDPIILAKEVATLDVLSGGRVELGVGVGWNRQEMRNHGTDPRTRTALVSDRIEALRAIWTTDPAEHHGRFVDFDPLLSRPKPVQKPHPRIWLAGWGPTTFARLLDVADGWMAPSTLPLDDLERGIAELSRAAAERGRPVPPVAATLHDATAAAVGRARDLGVEMLILGRFTATGEADALTWLDEVAALQEAAA